MISFALKLWALAKPYRVRLFLGVLTGVLCGLIEPVLLAAIKVVINVLFPGGEGSTPDASWAKLPAFLQDWLNHLSTALNLGAEPRTWAVALVVATLPLIMLARGVLGYLNIYFLQWAAIRAITGLRVKLFAHLMNLSLSFFNTTSTGDLISRIVSDTAVLQGVISNSLAVVVKEPATLVALLASLLYYHPSWTLMTLTVLPVCIVPIVIYSRKVRRSSAAIQTQFSEIAKIIHESFTGNRIVKAYNLEDKVLKEFSETTGKFVSHYMRVVRSMEIPGPLIEFMSAVGVAGFLFYIALTASESPTPGDFVSFILAIFLMYRPIKMITRLHSQLEQARAASERIFELLETKNTVLEPVRPVSLRAASAAIHFDNVDFHYGEKPVLRNIQLTVPAGKIVALVGASGSGKTTLTNLLLRFYDPQSGVVRINETDIRHVSLRELRNHIAVVTQETILFNDTIRNNIALGRPGASDTEIEGAARHAHAHEFIMQKPDGYNCVIGEKGVALSGGQRQRLAIARAILKNAPILILDEATNALDTESERAVQDALEELMHGGRTTICIAHRLSTVQNADQIVVMDQGRIVETGMHAELLAHGGIYQKLYALQFQS